MSNQLQITGGAKVRSLEGVITGTSGVLSSVPLGGANGVATLDSGGKVPVSQLPSSVVTYLGTWNAATNTPTLTNGTGDAGDMYICNVAGTVNFGAGPITFAVGDWVLYGSGTWQKSNGQNGTVTSVGLTAGGNALTITNSPITTAGNINVGFAGSSTQYIAGDGTLVTFPTIITEAQTLITDVYNETGATLTKGTVVYINGGHGNLPTVTKALATSDATSAQTYGVVQADITNNNNGHVVVIGSLGDLDTQAYAAGTQLYLSSTTAGAWTSTKQYAPAHLVYVGIVVRSHPTQGVVEIKIQNGFELDELHNVSAQTPSNNDGLFYNSSNSLWENKSIATALGYTPANDALVVKLAGTQTITGSKTFSATTLLNTIYVDGVSYLKNQTTTSYIAGYTTFSAKANGVIEYYFPSSFKSILDFNDGGDYTYTFPSASGNLVLGSGSADQVAYWNSASGLTYDSTFYYSASNKRLGVNTNTPNATIGANIAIDGGYGLLVKNADNNYNGLGIGIDSTYGNLIASQKLGTASARNVTILNQSGYHSLTEAGSFGLNILTPTASPSGVGSVGIDVYGGSNAAGIGFHNVASGVGNTNGAYIYLTNALSLTLRNLEGSIVSSSLGDFSVITNSTENFRVNASDGSLWQSNITSSLLKTNSSGVIVPAVAGTDYQTPITNPVSGTGTATRVAFWSASNTLSSNTNLYWDNTNARLGIGTASNISNALTIYSLAEASQLKVVGGAAGIIFTEALSAQNYVSIVGIATVSNNYITNTTAGDMAIANQTSGKSIFFGIGSTEVMRMTSGGLSITGTKSQLTLTGNSSNGAGITLNNLISGVNRRNWGIFTEQNVDGDFVIKRSDTAGGSALTGTTILSILNTGAATFSSSVTAGDLISTSYGTARIKVSSTTNSANSAFTLSAKNSSGTENTAGLYYVAGTSSANTFLSLSADNANYQFNVLSNGNVGIGTSSPSALLHLNGANTGYRGQLTIQSTDYAQITFYKGGTTQTDLNASIFSNIGTSEFVIRNNANAAMIFDTNGTERMRITSGGNVLIGTTTDRGYKFQVSSAGYFPQFCAFGVNDDGRYIGQGNQISGAFQSYDLTIVNYATSGRVTITNGVTGVYLPNGSSSWATYSDERLKNINGNIENAVEKLSNIRAVNYSWKSDETNKENLGLIAQDVENVLPQVIDKNKGFIENDNTEYLSVKYQELVPVLVKAIQELKAEIDELKNK